jgi:hypothetical protein
MVISGCISRSRNSTSLAALRSVMSAGVTMTNRGQALGVHDQVPFAAVDLLAGVVAAGVLADGLGSLDGLGVDDGGHRPGGPAHLAADPLAELVTDLSDHAGGGPAGHEPVTGAAGRDVFGQGPPLAAGIDHVADGVHDLPAGMLLRTAAGRSLAGRDRQQRLDQRPFVVPGVGGVAAWPRQRFPPSKTGPPVRRRRRCSRR